MASEVETTIITDSNEMFYYLANQESDPSIESPLENHLSLVEQGYILEQSLLKPQQISREQRQI